MSIRLVDPVSGEALSETAFGLADASGLIRYPFRNGVFQIVSEEGYSASFGFQWNLFARTQIDKSTGLDLSRVRLQAETDWHFDQMQGQNILEVGSGAGRFTQILLDSTHANIYSVDYSDAVSVNFSNNGPHERLKLFQASIYELPFAPGQFDKVICLGVLQHTPDIKHSIKCLAGMLKPGGELVVDFYPIRGWWTKVNAKYLIRPFAKKISKEKLLDLIKNNVDWMIKAYKFNMSIRLGALNRFIPIPDFASYSLPKSISEHELRELCILDAFDMFSPEYDQPQRLNTIRDYFVDCDLTDVFADYIRYRSSTAAVVRGRSPLFSQA
jgi:ubiquinone/menaquinone biosynthesis C-methylase UbiE